MVSYIGLANQDIIVLEESKIVICGCGKTGKNFLAFLKSSSNMDREIVFCDADRSKQGTIVGGIEVLSYETVIERYHNACFVIANLEIRRIMEELLKANINRIHIVR